MNWKPIIATLCGVLLLVGLVACGGAAEPEEETAAEGQPAANDSTQEDMAAVDGRQGGKLVRLFADPPTLDPHLTTDNISGILVNEIFGGLVSLSLDLEVVPDLAESIDTSADGLTYTFNLRRNAKFHDGSPVTAQDVKWSLERAAAPETQSPVAETYLSDIVGVKDKLDGNATEISGVRVVDDYTVEITIDAPKAYFLAKLTYPTAFILDQDNVGDGGSEWLRNPNGTGPFKLAQYEVGELMRFVRNDNYHREPAYLDEIEFILSGGSSMLMYENDEIHLTGVSLADLDRVLDPNDPLNAELHNIPGGFSVSYLGMNVAEPPFDDPKVRLALNLAIDRESIATNVLENAGTPARGIIPPGFPSYNKNLKTYDFDPERARQLVAESKYGDDLENLPRITLNITGSFGADVPPTIEAITKSWEDELGIQVDILQTEWATFLDDLHDKRFQMFSIGWGADYPDPENFLDILFHSKSDNNQTNYSNPEVDRLLEEARVERDRQKRFETYNRIEQMILDDAPWILLWNSGENYALIKPSVKDYHLTQMTIPKYRYIYFEN